LTVRGATIPECATRLASELEIAVNKRIIAELAQRGLSDEMDLPATATDIRLTEQDVITDQELPSGGVERTVQVTFGDRFEAHIARRIREHLVQQRLVWAGAGSGGTLLGLTFLWGTLKLAQRRHLRGSVGSRRAIPPE
jgi:hypothetical protein